MDENGSPNVTEGMQRFTATGRPYRPPQPEIDGWSTNALSGTESFGASPANLLPVKFTDESLISVPTMRAEDVGKAEAPKSKKSFWSSRRKSSNGNFTIRQVPRGDYLKYYAKDEDGKYIGTYAMSSVILRDPPVCTDAWWSSWLMSAGTEDPAKDCILRGDDIAKYRGSLSFKNEIGESGTAKADGVIR